MRGQAAFASDFYYGASPQQTSNAENAPGAPATPTTTGAIATAPNVAPKLDQVELLPQLRNLNPLIAIPFLIGLYVVLRLFMEWGHDKATFSRVRLDAWFAVAATISTLMLGPLFKKLLVKYKIPAISDYVNS